MKIEPLVRDRACSVTRVERRRERRGQGRNGPVRCGIVMPNDVHGVRAPVRATEKSRIIDAIGFENAG